jgi:hypothetical protein
MYATAGFSESGTLAAIHEIERNNPETRINNDFMAVNFFYFTHVSIEGSHCPCYRFVKGELLTIN